MTTTNGALPMKILTGLLAAALTLSLAACGSKEGGNGAAPSAPVAAVPPPAGTTWDAVIEETPEGGFMMGNPKAPIRVVEFGSYTCSHCRDFSEESSQGVHELVNSGKVSYEFRAFIRDPLDMTMALLARCGGKEPFFPLTEQLFGYQESMFTKAQAMGDDTYKAIMEQPADKRFISLAQATDLIDFVKQRGISEDQARQCLADAAKADSLAKGVQAATTQYNITGTPTLLINGSVVENVTTWDALRAKLREAGA